MFVFLMVLQGIIALSLIGVVLLQKSDGSGISGLGGSGNPSSFMSARGTANLLTRATGILAGTFMLICLSLAALVGKDTETKAVMADLEKTPSLEAKAETPHNKKTEEPSIPDVPAA